jgi:hypothetical protein
VYENGQFYAKCMSCKSLCPVPLEFSSKFKTEELYLREK